MEKNFVLRVPLRIALSSKSVSYCQGEFSLSHNSILQSHILNCAQLKWSQASLGCVCISYLSQYSLNRSFSQILRVIPVLT